MKYLSFVEISIVVLTILLLGLIYLGLKKAVLKSSLLPAEKQRIPLYYLLGIVAWCLVITTLALSGFLADFSKMPPRLPLVIVIPFATILFILFSKKSSQLLRAVPPYWLVYIQSFRIAVEVLLWLLFLDNLIPIQMTFEGRNWDVLSGITAIVTGFIVQKYGVKSKQFLVGWNLFGLGLLINIVTVAMLSIPSPFRYFLNEPANTIVTTFPMVLLPGVLVPIAYSFHLFSIKQLLIGRDEKA